MKQFSIKQNPLIFLCLYLAANSSWAGFSVTVTGTSDYVAEGISQSDSKPAYQGSIDYALEHGLYLGVWATSVDFGNEDDANYEQNWYVGWVYGLTENVWMDIGVTRYTYSNAPSRGYDLTDYHIGVTLFQNTSVTYHYEDDPDAFGEDINDNGFGDRGGRLSWWVFEQTIPLNDSWSVGVIVNYKKNGGVQDFFGENTGDDYINWNFTVDTRWHNFDFQLLYSDTSINSKDDPNDWADARLVLTVSRTFDF